MRRLIVMSLLTGVVIVCLTLNGRAEVYIGHRTAGSLPMERIDHSDWNRLLQTYVDDDGLVNYRTWHDNAADREALESYLLHLSEARSDARTPESARLAFWINAYNAVTVHGILREYPTSSIRNHTPRVVGYNIWKHLQLYVNGTPWSLNDIEHQILRKMDVPQIHFAIVCASVGCPRLLNEAYTSEQVHQQLERNSRDFFERAQNFRYSDGRFQLSAILDWFGRDFGGSQAEQLQAISAWLPTPEAREAAAAGRGDVRYLKYDWNLNEQQ